jgi:enolase
VSETISSTIEDVSARKVLDSRGNWTIEVDVVTASGFGRCTAPSGASTGKFEALSYPEGGVDKAVSKVQEVIAQEIVGMNAEEQEEIDSALRDVDGTENFSNIGGNTAVAVSLAVAKAAASSRDISLFKYLGGDSNALPYPLGNVIGGGAHASNATDIQEFLVIPIGASDVQQALWTNSEVHRRVKDELSARGKAIGLGKGDEGAWAPSIGDEEALEVLSKVTAEVGDELGVEISLGVDVASSEMWDQGKGRYVYKREGVERTKEEQVEHILELIERYDLYYVEDPLEEEDFQGFAELTKGSKALICGDDLYVTNIKRIGKGVKAGSSRAVLIKPNQIGTLTDTFKAINLANKNSLATVFSHRSGETVDDTIAHLAVAFGCPIIKTGVVGGERVAKLNELIRIEEELERRARMAHLPLLGGNK